MSKVEIAEEMAHKITRFDALSDHIIFGVAGNQGFATATRSPGLSARRRSCKYVYIVHLGFAQGKLVFRTLFMCKELQKTISSLLTFEHAGLLQKERRSCVTTSILTFLLIVTEMHAPNSSRVPVLCDGLLWNRLEDASGRRNSMLLLTVVCKLVRSF